MRDAEQEGAVSLQSETDRRVIVGVLKREPISQRAEARGAMDTYQIIMYITYFIPYSVIF